MKPDRKILYEAFIGNASFQKEKAGNLYLKVAIKVLVYILKISLTLAIVLLAGIGIYSLYSEELRTIIINNIR